MTGTAFSPDDFREPKTPLDEFLLFIDILSKYALLLEHKERQIYFKEEEHLKNLWNFDSGEIPASYLYFWLLLDFEFGREKKTVAERFLDSKILKDVTKNQNIEEIESMFLFTAVSYFTFYEVISCDSDKATLLELGTGNSWNVNKTGEPFENDLRISEICYTRLVGVRESAFFLAEPTFFEKETKKPILKDIAFQKDIWKKETGSYEEQDFRTLCKLFHPVWVRNIFAQEQESDDEKNPQPILLNTDKELFRFTTLEFRVKNPGAFKKAIEKSEKFELDEKENLWVWSRKETKNRGTILGTFKINDDILIAETNSIERGKRLRKLLEKEAGEHIVFEKFTVKEPDEIPSLSEEERIKFEEEQQKIMSDPETREILGRYYQEYYLKSWVRQKIPALGNKTPFQAVKTKKGKRKLVKLINWMERMSDKNPGGSLMDFNLLRQKLGIPIKK